MKKLEKLLMERKNKKIYKSGNSLIKEFDCNLVPKAEVLHEGVCQSRVEGKGINVPELQEVFKVGDNWCIAYDFIEGETLEEFLIKNPEKREEYLEKMLDLQIQIQQVDAPKLHRLTSKLQDRISKTKKYISATTRYELHSRLDSMPKHDKLCHCDFNPTNIIIDKKGDFYVLDWAHATKGNASADVAITYLWFGLKGRKEDAEKYLDMFCEKTDTAKQYVLRWVPIVAAAMSLKYEGKEKEFLLSTTDVVEYY